MRSSGASPVAVKAADRGVVEGAAIHHLSQHVVFCDEGTRQIWLLIGPLTQLS